MKLDNIFNEGACGIEQALYLGEIDFDTEDVATGVVLKNKLPKGFILTRAVCVVNEVFNGGTTNVVVLGTEADDDAFLAAADIAEDAVGVNVKNHWKPVGSADVPVVAKYTQTGTAATTGRAEFYAYLMKLPG
jgi:hypothetical protein